MWRELVVDKLMLVGVPILYRCFEIRYLIIGSPSNHIVYCLMLIRYARRSISIFDLGYI